MARASKHIYRKGRSLYPLTPYTSWSASPVLVFGIALDHWSKGKATYICILDTCKVNNVVAPSHCFLYRTARAPTEGDINTNALEYLIYGIIPAGEALKVVMFTEAFRKEFLQSFPEFLSVDCKTVEPAQTRYGFLSRIKLFHIFPEELVNRYDVWKQNIPGSLWEREPVPERTTIPLVPKDLEVAISLAKLFGPDFAIPVAAALLSMRPRSWCHHGRAIDRDDLHLNVCAFKQAGLAIPIEWRTSQAMVQEHIIDCDGYEDMQQFLDLLRTLVIDSWGRDANGRSVRLRRSHEDQDMTMK